VLQPSPPPAPTFGCAGHRGPAVLEDREIAMPAWAGRITSRCGSVRPAHRRPSSCDAAARELAAGDILYRPNPGVLLVRRCARAAEAGRARLGREDQR
jgi:hypothetical protein